MVGGVEWRDEFLDRTFVDVTLAREVRQTAWFEGPEVVMRVIQFRYVETTEAGEVSTEQRERRVVQV